MKTLVRNFVSKLSFVMLLLSTWIGGAQAALSPVAADVLVVIDESGSMRGEQRWIAEVVPLLEANLQAYGIGSESQSNLWGLVGFGNRSVVPRSLLLDGELLGDSDAFVSASGSLVTNGGTEDGWRGVNFALDEYPRRNGAAVNVILATDEDRDNTQGSITFDSILEKLNGTPALLNAVLNVRLYCGDNTRALGMDSLGVGYVADGEGGFTTCEGAFANGGAGRTVSDYVDLSVANGGAVWDLNFLRSGGLYAESFTSAILSIKVEEILSQRPVGDLVAVAQANPNPAIVGQTITLDGSQSFHQLEDQQIVTWEWDLDDDGTFDVSGPVVTTSFPALGEYPVTLRVIDDSDTPLVDEATVVVNVNLPPLEPTADSGGPYLFCPQNTPWRLDGSASVNPDDGLSEAGAPGDFLTAYQWDLNNDLAFDDASGALVDATDLLTGLGVGDHLIRLRVTDNTANAFPSSGLGNLSDIAVMQVSIRDESDLLCNCITDLAARPKATKVQLTWTDTGAASYAVYRSLDQGGPYQEIAVTDNRYSTYLDLGLELNTTYHYVVAERGANGVDTCRSREVAVTPTARRLNARNRPPVFTSAPITTATEGQLYSYDVEASDPDARDSVSFSLAVAPTGMTIDAISGLINWTPVNAQVGQQVVTVQASDRQSAFSSQTFVIGVANVNQAPTITSTPETAATENVAYQYTVQAIDPDLGDVLSFSLTTAPIGMSIDSATGLIEWTPSTDQIGTQTVTVVVQDSALAADTQTFAIVVVEQNIPPSITSTPVVEATVGSTYNYTATATDPNVGDSLTFALGAFPEGMTIDPITGLVGWVPTSEQIGVQTVDIVVSDSAGATTTQSFDITVVEANVAPVISTNALANATEDSGYTATILATDDNVGDVLTFSIVDGPAGLVIDSSTGVINWLPLNDAVGDVSLTVRVTDSGGLSAQRNYGFQVIGVNDLPSITSSPLTNAQSQVLYSYQVIAEDPDVGDTLTYALGVSPTGMTISATGLVQWTPPANAAASYSVEVLVTDSAAATADQTYVITMDNQVPVITSTSPASLEEQQTYNYPVAANDADGDTLTYALVGAPVGMTINTTTGAVAWSTELGDAGVYDFSIEVNDGRGGVASESVSLTVDARPNTAPNIGSTPVTSVIEGQAYQYQVVATDAESDPISYSLDTAPIGMSINSAGLVSWAPTNSDIGTHPVVVRVSDSQLAATQSYSLVVNEIQNLPPTIISTPETSAVVDSPYEYQVVATDPENDALTYSLVSGPAGMTMSPTGLVAWTPLQTQVGAQSVSLEVSDVVGNVVSQSFSIAVNEPPNDPPVITSTPATSGLVDTLYEYQVVATDPENDPLTYTLVSGPSGMAMSPTGLVAWTPLSAQAGVQSVSIQVSDVVGNTVTQSFSIAVTESPNDPPVISSTPPSSVTVGESYLYQVVASDPNGDALSYSLPEAPAGMSVNAAGLVNWTPSSSDVGVQSVAVRVTDAPGAYTTQTFTIAVNAGANNPPAISSSPVTSVNEGESYQYQVVATDPDSDPLTYSLSQAPVGMSIGASTGLINWSSPVAGNYPVALVVTDGRGGLASQSFTLVVTNGSGSNQAPIIGSAPVTTAFVGSSYSYPVTATDSDGDTLAFSLTQAPSGMSINPSSGLISWTPIAGQEGSSTVTIRVSDSQAYVEQTYTLAVLASVLDAEPLDVVINITPDVVTLGETVAVEIIAFGGVGERTVGATLNGSPLALVDGSISLPGLTTGLYELSVVVADTQESFIETQHFSVTDPTDADNPIAVIDGSNLVDPLTTAIDLVGTATDSNIADYKLYYSKADQNAWVEFAQGFTSVTDDVLAQLDVTLLENGTYDLLLQVSDLNGNTTGTSTTFTVEGDFKVGEFSITIKDLEVPMLGLPIEVNRNYDTRRKHQRLDFGYGWSVDYQAMDVSENQTLGLNWTMSASGGFFPTYCVIPNGPHFVTITRPDGRIDKFNAVATNNCSTLIPPLYVDVVFQAAPGTESSLTAANATGLRVNGSQLLDGSLIDLFDPNNYTLTTKDGLQFNISQGSGIRWIQDRGDNRITFTSAGIIHSSGKSIDFIRDGLGRITEIRDPSGESINYEYDAAGNLRRVIDREGNVVRHTYNRSHGLGEIYDPLGRRLSRNIYDESGKLVAIEDADGQRTEIDSDLASRTKQIRDRLGNVKTIEYDEDGNPIREVDEAGNEITRTFDSLGYLTSETDAEGNTTSYTYDAFGNRTSETDALGNTTSRTYDGFGNMLTETNALGQQTTYAYDINGKKIGEINAAGVGSIGTSDDSGNLLSITDSLGFFTNYERDAFGQATAEVDALGTRIEYVYDDNGNQTLEQTTVDDGLGGTRVLQVQREFDSNGNLTRLVDAEGNEQTFIYDGAGNLISETDGNGNTTAYSYDAYGRKIATAYADGSTKTTTRNAEGWITSSTDRLGRVTSYEYDPLGRRTQTTHPDGAITRKSFDALGRVVSDTDANGNVTSYEYDANGRRTAIVDALGGRTEFAYDAADNLVSETDPLGRTTSYAYDVGNRLTTSTYADGSVTSATWDQMNRKVSNTDANGNTTSFGYDAFDRLIAVTNALGNVTSYEYSNSGKFGTKSFSDPIGGKTAQTDASGRTINWLLDGLNRPTQRTLPDGSVELTVYDGAGQIISHTDYAGQLTNFAYNNVNQLVSENFADGSSIAYTYVGDQVATVTDALGETRYSYDAVDRLTRIDYPDSRFVAYTYDSVGNRLSVATANGTTLYEYDELNRLETVIDSSTGTTSYSYNAASELVRTDFDNGNFELRTYNLRGNLTAVRLYSSAATLLAESVYTTDAVGNRLQEAGVATTHDYTYDALNQLLSESITNGGSTDLYQFSYDAVGNRTSVNENGVVNTYVFDDRDRLVNDNNNTYSYDANGNLTQIITPTDTQVFAYDARNNLVSYSDSVNTETYVYDHKDNRVRKSSGGVDVDYLLDTGIENAAVLEATDGTSLSRFTYGLGRIAEFDGVSVLTHHHDGLGSTRALSNSSGLLTDSYEYSAFGLLLDHQGSDDNEFLFAGEQRDSVTGQYNLRARYYNPEDGRLTQVDPFDGVDTNPITLHDYAYAGNNPVLYTDPSGEIWGLFLRGASISRYAGTFARIRFLLRLQARGSVKQLRALKKTKKGIWRDASRNDEIHHIVEKRLLKQLGIRKVDDTPGIVLPKEVHRIYTQRWRNALPRRGQNGHLRNPSKDDIINAAYEVYRDSPIMLKEVLLFLL